MPRNAVTLTPRRLVVPTQRNRALTFDVWHAPGRRAFAVEGTGSFGAGLTRFLSGRGEQVLEVGRLRRERRSGGKTDALDAVRAARSVLMAIKALGLLAPKLGVNVHWLETGQQDPVEERAWLVLEAARRPSPAISARASA